MRYTERLLKNTVSRKNTGRFLNKENLQVLLVHFPFYESLFQPTPQLGLLSVAANLKASGFNTGVIDSPEISIRLFIDIVKEFRPSIIGFHVQTDTVKRVSRAIDALQEVGDIHPLIILGGPHVTIEDTSLLETRDNVIVVRGEGEHAAVKLSEWWINKNGSLETVKGITYKDSSGAIRKNLDASFITDLDSLPYPDFSQLIIQPQHKTYQIITGRGCPFHCAFCAEGVQGIQYRFRSPQSVLDEIRQMIGNSPKVYLGILDDTFFVDAKRVETIAKSLIKEYGSNNERLVWFCEGRVDFICRHKELLPLLREAGLVRIQIGIESGSQKILDLYRKQITLEQIENAVEILRDADIPSIFGNFILGGAMETPDTIEKSINFAKHLIEIAPGRMECSSSILGLFPGTAIIKSPEKFGIIIKDKEMLSCISLQHPVAETEALDASEILQSHQRFTEEIVQKKQSLLQSIPPSMIREHIRLLSYGVNTRWSELLMLFPAISAYANRLKRCAFLSFTEIKSKEQLMNLVPYRTVNVLNNESRLFCVNSHPYKVIFNYMAGEIYALCSGKVTLREMVSILRNRGEILPPEPFFTEQIIETLKVFDDQFLIVFSEF